MLRDVDAGQLHRFFQGRLEEQPERSAVGALKPQIDSLTATLKSIGEAKKGDAINFDYTPEGGTRISGQWAAAR